MDNTANISGNIGAGLKSNSRAAAFFRAIGRRHLPLEFIAVFTFFFGRFLYYGWRYFTQTGDYLSLNNHAALYSHADTAGRYIVRSGMLSASPLAGLADVFVWSEFFGDLIFLLLIFSLIYAVSAVVLRYVFEKTFGTGYLFTAVFCLYPFTLDGLYVLSNATHIVTALFFTSLAALCIHRFKETGRIRYIPVFGLTQLLTFGFNENVAILSAVVCMAIALKDRNKFSFAALLIAANFCIYAIYLQLGVMIGSVAETAAATEGYYQSVFIPATRGLGSAFAALSPVSFFGSVRRGAGLIFKENGYVYFALVVLACAGTAFLIGRGASSCRGTDKKETAWALVCGAIFAVTPIIPMFIGRTDGSLLCGYYPSLCGVALILDQLLRVAARGKKAIYVPVITAAVFLFCVAGVSELHDYRAVSEFDRQTANTVIEVVNGSLDRGDMHENTSVALLNVRTAPDEDPGFSAEGHLRSSLDDAGDLTEMLRAISGNGHFPTVTALPVDKDGYFYYAADKDTKRVEKFDHIFVSSADELIRVIPARGFTDGDYDPRANYENYLLYTVDFNRLAHVSEYAGYGIFKFY